MNLISLAQSLPFDLLVSIRSQGCRKVNLDSQVRSQRANQIAHPDFTRFPDEGAILACELGVCVLGGFKGKSKATLHWGTPKTVGLLLVCF